MSTPPWSSTALGKDEDLERLSNLVASCTCADDASSFQTLLDAYAQILDAISAVLLSTQGVAAFELLAAWCKRVRLFFSPPRKDEALAALAAVLAPEEAQVRLSGIVWDCLDASNSIASLRCNAALSSLLDFYALVEHDDKESASSVNVGVSRLVPLAERLLYRSLEGLERKRNLQVLSLLLEKLDPSLVAAAEPALYPRLLRSISITDGSAGRRGKLALAFLQRWALKFGLLSKKNKLVVERGERWKAWTHLWVDALVHALTGPDELGRRMLGLYHLPGLVEFDPSSFYVLAYRLTANGHPTSEAGLEALLLVLQLGAAHGLCEIASADAKEDASSHSLFSLSDFQESSLSSTIAIPQDVLRACATAASPTVRLSVLAFIVSTRSSSQPLTRPALQLLKMFLSYNLSSTEPEVRQAINGTFVSLLIRLRASTYAAHRDASKLRDLKVRTSEEDARLKRFEDVVDDAHDFLRWVRRLVLRTLHPCAAYHDIIAALRFLNLLLQAGTDRRFFTEPPADPSKRSEIPRTVSPKVAGKDKSDVRALAVKSAGQPQDFPFQIDLVTPCLVRRLLRLVLSKYDDIQLSALSILEAFPGPLAGLESEEDVKALVGKAARMLLSARDTESSAGALLVKLVLKTYVLRAGWTFGSVAELVGMSSPTPEAGHLAHLQRPPVLALVDNLLDFFEALVSVAKRDLLVAAERHSLHGLQVALQHVFMAIDLSDPSQVAHLSAWRSVIRRAVSLINQTWEVTKAVLCNVAPEGSAGQGGENDQEDASGIAEVVTPDLEEARALNAAQKDGGDAMAEVQSGPRFQVILSFAWRAMKEAGALLGVLISRTLSQGEEVQRAIWTPEEIAVAGDYFNTWLTQIRHRGAFSTLYPSYSVAAAAVIRSGWEDIDKLPQAWVEGYLKVIFSPTLSATRRSAGVPYCVLALLVAQPRDQEAVLRSTVGHLFDAARSQGTTDVAKIHAFNVFRVLMLDAQLSTAMAHFIEDGFKLSIEGFSSQSWGIRNASMMLFAALCDRAFGSRRNNLDERSARLPLEEFFGRFPGLYPFLQEELKTAVAKGLHDLPSSDLHSSLFAVLMMFSRCQALNSADDSKFNVLPFLPLVESCVESRIWKIRETAARSLSSLVRSADSLKTCVSLLSRCSLASQNGLHGRLLQMRRLLATTDPEGSPNALEELASLDRRLAQRGPELLGANPCPASQAAFLEVVLALQDLLSKLGGGEAEALGLVRIWAARRLEKTSRLAEPADLLPAEPYMLSVAARCLSSSNGSDGTLLLEHAVDTVRLVALDEAQTSKRSSADDQDSRQRRALLLSVVLDASQSARCRVLASQRLAGELVWASDTEAGSSSKLESPSPLEAWRSLFELTERTACVPLREAILPLLGILLKEASYETTMPISHLVPLLETWADEEQSEQSRYAVILSLKGFSSQLFPALDPTQRADLPAFNNVQALFRARLLVIRLLSDDDPAVREEAAKLISERLPAEIHFGMSPPYGKVTPGDGQTLLSPRSMGLASTSEMSVERAMRWMCDWYCVQKMEGEEGRRFWTEWLWSSLMPKQSELDDTIRAISKPSSLLFAFEPPNVYRDSDREARLARRMLSVFLLPNDVDMGGTAPPRRRQQVLRTLERLVDTLEIQEGSEGPADEEKNVPPERTPKPRAFSVAANIAFHLLALKTLLAFGLLDQEERERGSFDEGGLGDGLEWTRAKEKAVQLQALTEVELEEG